MLHLLFHWICHTVTICPTKVLWPEPKVQIGNYIYTYKRGKKGSESVLQPVLQHVYIDKLQSGASPALSE